MAEQLQMFIDGAWVGSRSGERFDTIDPATGAVLASLPRAGADDVDLAVVAARRTFDDGTWGSAVAARERARLLLRIAELVREHRRELAELEVRDCGKPIGDAEFDIDEVAFMFEYYAGWATKISGDIPPVGPQAMSLIVKEPVGVCGLIVPWNYPMLMAAQKVAPALATGCTVVLKPAEQTPLTALRMAALAEQAGIPAGVFNVVTGYGTEAGQPLLTHPGVDKISFTGSKDDRHSTSSARVPINSSGSRSSSAARARTSCSPTPPSNAPCPARRWASSATRARCARQAVVCSCTARSTTTCSQGMTDFAAGMRLGSGLDPDDHDGSTRVGSSSAIGCRATSTVGQGEGAKLVYAGQRPSDPALAEGFFVAPTIFEATNVQRIAREEIFGPVAAVIPFESIDDVVSMSNDTEYGLAAAIWTRDIGLALRTAHAVRAGVVWINDSQPAPSETMWGGFKHSGIGRELGPYALDAYLESKQIYINLA